MELFEINDQVRGKIPTLFERTEESLFQDVETLKKWMETQHHLPEILDDDRIKNFLLLNKCSVEITKKKIDMYYTIKTAIPDIYRTINPKLSNMKNVMDIMYWVPLPKLTNEMYRVIFFKIRDTNMMDKMEPNDTIRHYINMQEVRLKEDIMYGDILVFDLAGLNMTYIRKLTPVVVSKCFSIFEKVYSIRIKAMYLLNTPSIFNTVITILKSVLKPKIFDRMEVCSDTSLLYQHFPKEVIPKDYGGDATLLEDLHNLLKTKFDKYQSRFDCLDKLEVKEMLRPERLENDETLGFYGNFKELSFD